MTSLAHARSMLSSTISAGMQDALRAHRAYIETLAEQSVRDGSAVGFIQIDGVGESVVEVTFPIKFLEKPSFTAGLELGENTWLRWGGFPQWSATVGSWITEPADGGPLYVGALLGVLTSGTTKSVLHYRFEAQSFTNPVGASYAVGATL